MGRRDPEVTDRDPTGEEEAPDFDGTQTDVLDDTYRMRVASASENSAAAVDYNDRGRKRIESLTKTEPKAK